MFIENVSRTLFSPVGKICLYPKREGFPNSNLHRVLPVPYGPPFQFPSNGKVFTNRDWLNTGLLIGMFQFPSNGKVFLNSNFSTLIRGTCAKVSIPFKREGLSDHDATKKSLRNRKFQFPSNGKVFPNRDYIGPNSILDLSVSIPFKREGLSEQI